MRSFILIAALTVSLPWCAKCPAAQLYKWVDDKGQVHYSDSVPPEAINKKRDVIDKKGMVVDEIGAAKTKAQLEEEERRKKQAAIEQQQLEARQQHDRMLLQTYNSVDDIITMRKRKLAAIDDIVTLNKNRIDKLEQKLVPLRAQIAAIQKNRKEIPDDLQAQVKALENHIATRGKIIKQNCDEQVRLRKQFQQDLERFTELTGHNVPDGQQVNSGSGSPRPHP